MSTKSESAVQNDGRALDRQDERVTQYTGLRGALKETTGRVRSGELGALPVVIGLVLIAIVFQVLNPLFLSSTNLVNLTLEASSVGVISLGVVCVLLVGEIDLSVGSVSGLSGALVAVLGVQKGLPMALAIAVAVATGLVIGVIYGRAFTRFGMPSFVATLAGLLGFLGLQLFVLGAAGSINIPFNSGLVRFAQQSFLPPRWPTWPPPWSPSSCSSLALRTPAHAARQDCPRPRSSCS